MSIYTALGQGFRLVRANMYVVWLIYFSTLFIALLFVLPFQQSVSSEIGQSLEIMSMLESYRHTVVADFLNSAGSSVFGLIGQLKWLIFAYILLSIFFSGSILHSFTQKSSNRQTFLQGGAIYFSRFLRLSVLIWGIQILLAVVIHYPFISQLMGGLDGIKNEIAFFRTGLIGILLHIPIAILFFSVSDFAKAHMVATGEKRVWVALKQTIILFRKFFLKTYSIFVLNGLLIVVIYIIYLLVSNWIDMTSGLTIIIMFFVQQFFSVLRVVGKAIKLGSILSMYEHLESEISPVGVPIQSK